MKIALTGHTKGLGKSLFDKFQINQHEVLGFSRSNGYDLTNANTINKIVTEIENCDVFINNALPSQITLFENVFKSWQNDNTKTIVNISSFLKYRDISNYATEYSINKNKLYKSTLKPILEKNKQCRLICINPGYIDTDMVRSKNVVKMSPDDCADIICWAINQPQYIEVGELSFWITNSL